MDDDWAKTINEEYGTDAKADEPDTDELDTPDTEAPEEPDTPETPESDESEESDDKPEADEPEAPEKPADEPEEKYSPKEDIKKALQELQSESQRDTEVRTQLKETVIEQLYPEGIDRQLRDADGDPITSIEDLTKLINPKTDDFFTEDEAGAWLLSAQQKLNNEIAQIEKQAEQVVEAELELRDGANRVEQVYGDILEENPELAQELMQQYNDTIIRDPKSGLILKMPVNIERFYRTALSGYEQAKALQRQQEEAAAKAKAEAEAKQRKTAQHERSDLSRLGEPDETLSKEDKGWVEAMKEYYNS